MLSIFVPLIVGSLMYYLFFPDILFVRFLDGLTGHGIHISLDMSAPGIWMARCYLFDILWAYSLTSAVCSLVKSDFYHMPIIFGGLVLFEVIMESIQLLPGVRGTFDVCDIAAEIIVNILVIKIYSRREKK